MFNKYPTMTSEAISLLRSWQLADHGTYIETCEAANDRTPQHFVRCGRNIDKDTLARVARNICEATGDEPKFVIPSYHPDYGDYLRVRRESRAYAFACYLKS